MEERPILIEFKSLEKDNKYYTLDGITEINSHLYQRSIYTGNINRLSKEEILDMVKRLEVKTT